YAVYALVRRPGTLPGGTAIAWLVQWPEALGWGLLLTFTPLLFPTGRPPSPRWRPVVWLAAGSIALLIVVWALRPGPPDPRYPSVVNPLGIEPGLYQLLRAIVTLSLLPTAVACLAATVVRFRRAGAKERQQLKWFAYATGALLLWSTAAGLSRLLHNPVLD